MVASGTFPDHPTSVTIRPPAAHIPAACAIPAPSSPCNAAHSADGGCCAFTVTPAPDIHALDLLDHRRGFPP